MPSPAPRRRRRAVGPAGSAVAEEPALDLRAQPPPRPEDDDAERWQRERPPHHDRGV